MFKKILPVITILLLFNCSSISVKRTKPFDNKKFKKMAGGNAIIFVPVRNERVFNHRIKIAKSLGDKKVSAVISTWKWVENQYFIYEIKHIKAITLKGGDINFTFTDSKNNNILESIISLKGSFSDGVLFHSWVIKTGKPVSKLNYSENSLPLTFVSKIKNAFEEKYEIVPEK